jgi:hypothetical protein
MIGYTCNDGSLNSFSNLSSLVQIGTFDIHEHAQHAAGNPAHPQSWPMRHATDIVQRLTTEGEHVRPRGQHATAEMLLAREFSEQPTFKA